MSVMHLRLERPEAMAVPATGTLALSPDTDAISPRSTEESAAVASLSEESASEDGDAAVASSADVGAEAVSANSTLEGISRVPSMNLATDPTLWVGDATTSPGRVGQKTSRGQKTPFDTSSDEDDDDDEEEERVTQTQTRAGDGDAVRGGFEEGFETPGTRPIARGSNPFDFSFYDSQTTASATASTATAGGAEESRGDGIDNPPSNGEAAREMAPTEAIFPPAAAGVFPASSPSSRISELFPVGRAVPAATTTIDSSPAPDIDQLSLTPRVPPRMESLDLALLDSPAAGTGGPCWPLESTGESSTALSNRPPLPALPTESSSAAAAPGVAKAPRDKGLPPMPLLAFGAEGSSLSCSSPTPPVTPFSTPSAVASAGLIPAVQDKPIMPSPSAAQGVGDVFSAFQDSTAAAPPPPAKDPVDALHHAFRDSAATPAPLPPSKAQMDLHLAFRDNTTSPQSPLPAEIPVERDPARRDRAEAAAATPAPGDGSAILPQPGGANSSEGLEDFNPFGRPGSFVLSQPQRQHPAGGPPPTPAKNVRNLRAYGLALEALFRGEPSPYPDQYRVRHNVRLEMDGFSCRQAPCTRPDPPSPPRVWPS